MLDCRFPIIVIGTALCCSSYVSILVVLSIRIERIAFPSLEDYEMKITNGIIDRRVPLLRDVFSAFPTLPINLDVKTENPELLDKVSLLR